MIRVQFVFKWQPSRLTHLSVHKEFVFRTIEMRNMISQKTSLRKRFINKTYLSISIFVYKFVSYFLMRPWRDWDRTKFSLTTWLVFLPWLQISKKVCYDSHLNWFFSQKLIRKTEIIPNHRKWLHSGGLHTYSFVNRAEIRFAALHIQTQSTQFRIFNFPPEGETETKKKKKERKAMFLLSLVHFGEI